MSPDGTKIISDSSPWQNSKIKIPSGLRLVGCLLIRRNELSFACPEVGDDALGVAAFRKKARNWSASALAVRSTSFIFPFRCHQDLTVDACFA